MSWILKVYFVFFVFSCVKSSLTRSFLERLYDTEDYRTPNERSGKVLREWMKSGLKRVGNPEEQGNYFEGDILVDNEGRNGIILAANKWKDGKIPFEIQGSFSQQHKNMLSDAIEKLQQKTCLKFLPHGGEKDFIVIQNEATGCWSSVGKTGGPQTVNYQTPGCLIKLGTVMHELLHAVGFYHEQNRFDRDRHVRINTKNIPEDKLINFERISEKEISDYGVGYDVKSVLHYSPFAFSKNNQMTIESLKDKKLNDEMGQREKLSAGDVKKINSMYCGK